MWFVRAERWLALTPHCDKRWMQAERVRWISQIDDASTRYGIIWLCFACWEGYRRSRRKIGLERLPYLVSDLRPELHYPGPRTYRSFRFWTGRQFTFSGTLIATLQNLELRLTSNAVCLVFSYDTIAMACRLWMMASTTDVAIFRLGLIWRKSLLLICSWSSSKFMYNICKPVIGTGWPLRARRIQFDFCKR